MGYREYKGNLFASQAHALVNSVNCAGIMGKGIALEFRRRFPQMYTAYQAVCARQELRPGQIWPYRHSSPWILNFAVKDDWKRPSRLDWVESCLKRFHQHASRLRLTSVAFPWIGAMNGGLPWPAVHALMRRYLKDLPIDIEVVEFDSDASDPLFERIRNFVANHGARGLTSRANLSSQAATLIVRGLDDGVSSMSRLCAIPGLGNRSIEAIYAAFVESALADGRYEQLPLLGERGDE